MRKPVYLDYNATAPLRPEAKAAVTRALDVVGNPSSVHGFGRAARRVVEEAREQVATLVGADPACVVFTGGGTEANNLALRGLPVVRTFVSAVEHDSVLRAKPGAVCLPVDGEGVVRLDALETFLAAAERPALVSVMLVNNETGVIQPIGRVVEIARRYGALVHTDAVQAVGKMDVNLAVLGVDLLTLSAHKLGGPQGAGALVLGRDLDLRAQLVGGGQERGRRAGTENVAALAGFGAAAVAAREDLAAEPWLGALRDRIEREILAACPGVKVAGANAPRVGTTTCLLMPGVPAETQLMAFDLAGVAVSSGAACSSGKVQPSHVLAAMGYGEAEAKTAVRASFGWATLESDAERFIEVWIGVYRRLGTQAAAE